MEKAKGMSSKPVNRQVKNIWVFVITVVIVALIVGFGVYFWQQSFINQQEQRFNDLAKLAADQKKPDLATGKSLLNPPYCITGEGNLISDIAQQEAVKKEFAKQKWINYSAAPINNLFNLDDFRKLGDKMTNPVGYTICDFSTIWSGDGIVFVLYGIFNDNKDDYDNIIGVYYRNKLTTEKRNNPPSGDWGICQINGHINDYLIYSCSGGDGGAGWDKKYLLNIDTGESKIIRDCSHSGDEAACSVDLLDI